MMYSVSGVTRGEHLCVRVLLLMLVTQGLWRHWRLLWTLTSGPLTLTRHLPRLDGAHTLTLRCNENIIWRLNFLMVHVALADCSDL